MGSSPIIRSILFGIMNCYFCTNPLLRCPTDSTYYGCYQCPLNNKHISTLEAWRPIHLVDTLNHSDLRYEHVYLHSIDLYLCVYLHKHDDGPFTCIKDNLHNTLFTTYNVINIFKYTPSELEHKIKTWITFS